MALDPDDDLIAALSIGPVLFGNGGGHLIFDSIKGRGSEPIKLIVEKERCLCPS